MRCPCCQAPLHRTTEMAEERRGMRSGDRWCERCDWVIVRESGCATTDVPDARRASDGLMPTIIDRQAVQELVARGAHLVEVLPAEEYAEEHLPGAISLPLKELDARSATRLDRTRPLIVYCHDLQ